MDNPPLFLLLTGRRIEAYHAAQGAAPQPESQTSLALHLI